MTNSIPTEPSTSTQIATEPDEPTGEGTKGAKYPWVVVGLLWFCGFFNYADRQAVFSVFPLLNQTFGRTLTLEDKGLIGSAFMVIYALSSPFTGLLVDRLPRRWLISSGLAIWSVVCSATAFSKKFWQLLFFRAAEGLGESCYFPASMSVIADYHGPKTRSRAMSLHQTSVYAGTAVGGMLAGYLGQRYGWQSPFLALGAIGLVYAAVLPFLLAEPRRAGAAESATRAEKKGPFLAGVLGELSQIVRTPAALVLLVTFAGANFVAATLMAWLPNFVLERHKLDLFGSAVVATLFMPTANLFGAILGGAWADSVAHRPGGRARVQAAGLLLGAPCVFLVGWTSTLTVLIPALIGIGLCKGIYDANIFASLYDVVRPGSRGFAAGLMNTIGWSGAGLAPWLIGKAGDRYGLSRAIAATAVLYLVSGLLALLAAAITKSKPEAVESDMV